MTEIEIEMLPKQLELLDDDRKLVGVRGGVGSGKTVGIAWWQIKEIHAYPKAQHAVIGASFGQLKLGYLRTMLGILERHKIPYKYTALPRPRIEFPECGAELLTLSSEMREQLRSLEIDRLVVEEPQTWDGGSETFITLIERLRPSPSAVTHYPGMLPKIRASFNPPAVGHWLHTLFEKTYAGKYPCYRFSLRDNTIHRRIDPEYLPFMLTSLPQERWDREIDGEWGTVATGVYSGFDVSRHTIEALREECPQKPMPGSFPPFAIDESKPLCWTLDFNVEWMASLICQWHSQPMVTRTAPLVKDMAGKIEEPSVPGWQKNVCYVLGELFIHDAGIPDVLREFLRIYGDIARKTGVELYGDPAGGGRSQVLSSRSTARSAWKIIKRDLTAAGIKWWDKVRSAPPIIDRVYAVREQFDMNGLRGLVCAQFPNGKASELINDFNIVQWVPGKNEIDKSDKSDEGRRRTHISDALCYMVHTKRRPEAGGDFRVAVAKNR